MLYLKGEANGQGRALDRHIAARKGSRDKAVQLYIERLRVPVERSARID